MSEVALGTVVFGEWPSGAYDAGLPVQPITPQKVATFRIYTPAGVFVGTWEDTMSWPVFSRQLFGNASAIEVQLPRSWGEIGLEGEPNSRLDVKNGYKVDINIVDRQGGLLIYRGVIRQHRTLYPSGNVSITIMPLNHLYKQTWIDENSTFTFVDTDPSDMAKALLDAGYIPESFWMASNPKVGQVFTQEFVKMNVGQALDIIVRLAGDKWYYESRPNGDFVFNRWSTSRPATHQFSPARYSQVEYVYSTIDTVARVTVYGAEIKDVNGIVTGRIVGQAAKSEYLTDFNHTADLVITDERITDAEAAQRHAFVLLEAYGQERIETEVEVPDDNLSLEGYDIETLNCGDTVSLKNAQMVHGLSKWDEAEWDEDMWDTVEAGLPEAPLVIQEISYEFTKVRLKLSTRPDSVVQALVGVLEQQLVQGAT